MINNSIAAAMPTSALLQQRAATELDEISDIAAEHPRRAVVPMLAAEPTGIDALTSLASFAAGSTTCLT